jgi:murein DD-endopeptidase MepM/ murein hydrolase activator NlpD
MDELLHIIITGERGKIIKLQYPKKKLRIIATVSAVILLSLCLSSLFSVSLFTRYRIASSQLTSLQQELDASDEIIARQQEENDEQRLQHDLQLARLELNNIKQNAFSDDKESLISNAVNELNERSEIIGRIISSIGIKLPEKDKAEGENSGGPFIRQSEEQWDELLFKADKYLNTIRYLPFGKPLEGNITSRYGKRKDPLNKKSAFHSGIDIRGEKGDKIFATGDGIVKKAFRNGGHGNYVMIDHGNGYTTSFSHMKKFVVRKGDRIERGQLIGHVGNTGRSTGPHLHYEIALDKKTINPIKFLRVAKLLKSSTSSPEKE